MPPRPSTDAAIASLLHAATTHLRLVTAHQAATLAELLPASASTNAAVTSIQSFLHDILLQLGHLQKLPEHQPTTSADQFFPATNCLHPALSPLSSPHLHNTFSAPTFNLQLSTFSGFPIKLSHMSFQSSHLPPATKPWGSSNFLRIHPSIKVGLLHNHPLTRLSYRHPRCSSTLRPSRHANSIQDHPHGHYSFSLPPLHTKTITPLAAAPRPLIFHTSAFLMPTRMAQTHMPDFPVSPSRG